MIRTTMPSTGVMRSMAEGVIAQKLISEIKPNQYLMAIRRAAKRAVEAAAKDDYQSALLEKQRELLNLELYRAALDSGESISSTIDYLRSFDKKSVREQVGKAGQDYLDQIDVLRARVELKTVSNKVLQRRKSLLEWIRTKEETGQTIDIDPRVLDEAQSLNYRQLTLEELNGVRDAVKNIDHMARFKNQLLRKAEKRRIDEIADDISASINRHVNKKKRKSIETRLPKDEAMRAIDGFFAAHRKLGSYARQMDGFKDGGSVWEYLVRPVNDAANEEAVAKEKANMMLWDIFKRNGQTKNLYTKTYIPELNMSMSKMGRLMVALNRGNQDNWTKLLEGYGWSESQGQAILDTLNQQDWTFVQETWDYINSYWLETKAKEERVTGVAPEKVEAMPFMTRFGEMKGGYLPIKYDERQSPRAYADAAKDAADAALKGSYTKSTTRRGHTKARVEGVQRQIRLDFGVIFEHVQEVIHDLSHHEMLIDINRVLGNKKVQQAIIGNYGDIVYRQLQHIISDVAAGDVPAIKSWERSVNWLRTGTSVATMGWNVSTALIQILGLNQSIVRIGPKWIARGISRWFVDAAHMENTAKWIFEKSSFMRLRGKTMQREINEIRNVVKGRGKLQAIQDTYFWLIVKMQQTVDIPTWLGQYEKSMSEHGEESKAIAEADQAVIDTQGSGHIKDLSEMQRGGPLQKLWTNFYHYFNTTFNLTAESFRRKSFKHPSQVGRFMVDMMMLYTVPAVLGYLIREALRGGMPDDDDKLMEELLREQFAYMAGTMIGFRELTGVIQGYYGYGGPAGARLFSQLGNLGRQIGQGEVDEAMLRSLNEVMGIVFHYPSNQFGRLVRGYFELQEGKTENPAVILLGPPPKK